MATVDNLDIRISTTVTNADKALNKLEKRLNKVATALNKVNATNNKVTATTNKHTNSVNRSAAAANKAQKSFKGLSSMLGKMYQTYFWVSRGIKALWSSLEGAADYIEAYNYFDVALGKIGKDWEHQFEQYGYSSAEEYAESFSTRLREKIGGLSGIALSVDADGNGVLTSTNMKNLGLNIQEITQYASQLASVTNSVGQTGETSLAAASAFTKLGADMSSLFNMDYSAVMKNLQSGLIGQSRALYKYGIDITNASLQTLAYELGVEKAVAEMNQMEKMQLRMIKILNDSKVSWGDLANTINSPSNMIRQMKNNLKELSMVLGQMFVPLVKRVVPFINGLTIGLKSLMASIAGMFGLKLEMSEYGQGYTEIEDGAEDATDAIEDMTEATKKLKTATLGIDELNINNPQSDTESESGVGGGLDLTQQITDAVAEYEKHWQDAFDNMENLAEKWAQRIEKSLEPIKKLFQDISVGDWFAVGEDVSGLVSGIFNFFTRALENVDWYSIGQKFGAFLEGVNWTEIMKSIADFVWTAIQSSFEQWQGVFDAAPLETTIITAIALLKWTGLGAALWGPMKTAIKTWFSTKILSLGKIPLWLKASTFTIAFAGTPAFDVIGNKILDGIDAVMEDLLPDWAMDFFGKLIAGISTGAVAGSWIPGFGTIAGAIIGGIIGAFSTEDGGKSFWSVIVEKLFNFDLANDWFEQAKESFKTAFDGKRQDWLDVGLWIIQGIGEGIVGALTGLVEPIADLFQWTWDEICNVFGINSPAKEMEPLGENIFLGIIEGFKSLFSEFTEHMQEFWNNYVSPWFTKEKWTELLESIPGVFLNTFKIAANFAIDMINGVIGGFEYMVNMAINGLKKLAELANLIPGVNIDTSNWGVEFARIPKYELDVVPKSTLLTKDNYDYFTSYRNGSALSISNPFNQSDFSDNVGNKVADALAPYLLDIVQNTRDTADKDVSVNIGDRDIYKASIRGARSSGRPVII